MSKFARLIPLGRNIPLIRCRGLPFIKAPIPQMVRRMSDLIWPTQYDQPYPKRLSIIYTATTYYETIPLFCVVASALSVLFCAIYWACRNKVDIVFSTNSRANISRTMDLRNPSVHKIVIINQRYEPWPEMQDVLDKMHVAQKRAESRALTCGGV